jgi:hypothetical protein
MSWMVCQNQFPAAPGDGSIAGLPQQRGNLALPGKNEDAPGALPI